MQPAGRVTGDKESGRLDAARKICGFRMTD
jgi:hypothetical protein